MAGHRRGCVYLLFLIIFFFPFFLSPPPELNASEDITIAVQQARIVNEIYCINFRKIRTYTAVEEESSLMTPLSTFVLDRSAGFAGSSVMYLRV